MAEYYDLIVVGTSFAGAFFLHKYLDRFGSSHPRVLVLEWGQAQDHVDRLESGKPRRFTSAHLLENRTPEKKWAFEIGLGGTSAAWWACTPRFMPNDFRMKTKYGVARDWPMSYDDLEPYYCDAEELLSVSGGSDTPYPRSKPCPLPAHLMSEPDQVLAKAYPGKHIPMPCARWSVPLDNPPRAQCCAYGGCAYCPVDAKYTIQNSMMALYERPEVELRLEHQALAVDTKGNTATGVTFVDKKSGVVGKANADLIVLGANPIFNPVLLWNSGLDHKMTGKNLCEQVSTYATAKLKGLKSFGGSTSLTGSGFMLYDEPYRNERAGALLEISNIPRLRTDPGRWREVTHFKVISEILHDPESQVGLAEPADPEAGKLGKPFASFAGLGEYTERTIRALESDLNRVLSPLPVEELVVHRESASEGHICGTTVMGDDPEDSVLDGRLRYHGIDNLILTGCGAFPTTPPSNPTLTLCALSLWAADKL